MDHPTTDLIAYLTGELTPVERERIETHLAACPDCRDQRNAFQTLLDGLRTSAPAPPEVHWGRWRADLRARLEPRTAGRRWRLHPWPAALATGLAAAALIAIVWLGEESDAPRTDLASSVEEVVLGDHLDSFLEDLDVIDQLDRLVPRAEG
jgi:anti-sigma factor RsiW